MNPFSTLNTMKAYQVYFFFLKIVVFSQVVMLSLGYKVAESSLFAIVDTIFKISLGLFLGIYFWLFRPRGIEWEDGIIISIGGFLILSDIHFAPLMKIYEARDVATSIAGHTIGL